MTENRIEKHVDLKAAPPKVWRALTNHQEFGEWFGVKLEGPFVTGRTVAGRLTYPGFEHMQWAVDVKKMETERLFSFTWHPFAIDVNVDYSQETPTLVEFQLTALGTGTHLVVVESGFENIPANRRLEAFRMDTEGWIEQMENIAKYVG